MNASISNHDWNKINDIILLLNSEEDILSAMNLFLVNIDRIIPYDKASIILYSCDQRKFHVESFVGRNYSDSEVKIYNDYFYGLDDILNIMYKNRLSIARSSDLVDMSARIKTEYYRDYIMPVGTHYSLDAYLDWHKSNNVESFGSMDLFRTSASRDFSEREQTIYRILRPHLELKVSRYALSREDIIRDFLANYHLTKCEISVALMITRGYTNDEIASRLFITTSTVKKHVSSIFEKLAIKSRVDFLCMTK